MNPNNNENNDNKPVLTPVKIESHEEHHGLLTIICFIVLCILIGVGVFFAYKHFVSDNDKLANPIKEDNKKEEEIPQVDNEEDDKKEDEDNHEDDDYVDDDNNDNGLSDEEIEKQVEEYKEKVHQNESINEKKIIEFIGKYKLDFLYYPSKINLNEPSSELERVALWYIKDNHEGEGSRYNKEEFDKYFKNIFDVVPTKYVDIICHEDDLVFYYYKDGMFVYNENHGGHGAYYAPGFTDYHIIDYKEVNNQYIIKLIFADIGMDGYRVNGEEDESVYDINELDTIKYFHEHIDKYKSYGVLEYTLEKKDDSFIIKSFKIIK